MSRSVPTKKIASELGSAIRPWPYVGQGQLGSHLISALQADTFGPVIFFHGPAHVGKRSGALWIAQADRCRSTGNRPCLECPSCQAILHNQHPEVTILGVEDGPIDVETVRLVTNSYTHVLEVNERRWLIIPEAQRLTESAANTLLKFLEEPPPQTFVILTSSQPMMLPLTLISRASQYAWHLVPKHDMAALSQDQERINRAIGRPGLLVTVPAEQELADVDAFLQMAHGQPGLPETELKTMTPERSASLLNHWELCARELLLVHWGSQRRLWPMRTEEFAALRSTWPPSRIITLLQYLQRRSLLLAQHVSPRLLIHDIAYV